MAASDHDRRRVLESAHGIPPALDHRDDCVGLWEGKRRTGWGRRSRRTGQPCDKQSSERGLERCAEGRTGGASPAVRRSTLPGGKNVPAAGFISAGVLQVKQASAGYRPDVLW